MFNSHFIILIIRVASIGGDINMGSAAGKCNPSVSPEEHSEPDVPTNDDSQLRQALQVR